MKCPNCGHENAPGALFCDNCGTRLAEPATAPAVQPAGTPPEATPAGDALICPQCGTPYAPGEAFCSNCGAKLPAPAPSVPAPEASQPTPAAPAPSQPAPGPAAQPSVQTIAPTPALAPQAAPAMSTSAPVAPPARQAQAVPAPAPARTAGTCPQCGNPVAPGQAFCDNCGASLAGVTPAPGSSVPAPSPGPTALVAPASAPALAGPRLVVVASGAQIPLGGKSEYLIGREDPVSNIFPDVDLTPHGGDSAGISRRHAILGWQNGQGWIEDLNSVNGTWVNKQRVPASQRQPLTPGSEIRLGRMVLQFQA